MVELTYAEILIIIECADSRQVTVADMVALERYILQKAQQRIEVKLFRISGAGDFITPRVASAVKDIITSEVNSKFVSYGNNVSAKVLVLAHGRVVLHENADVNAYRPNQIIHTPQGSQIECGMVGAEKVAQEFFNWLIDNKVTLKHSILGGEITDIKIENIKDVGRAIYSIYGCDANNFIKSVNLDIVAHVKTQASYLRSFLQGEKIPICVYLPEIYAGVINYLTNQLLIAGGSVNNTFQEIYGIAQVESIEQKYSTECQLRSNPQKPSVAVFAADCSLNYRTIAMDFSNTKNMAGTIFAVAANPGMKNILVPIDPHDVVSMFYAASEKHLGIKEWVIVANNEREFKLIKSKLENGFLTCPIIQKFNITFKFAKANANIAVSDLLVPKFMRV